MLSLTSNIFGSAFEGYVSACFQKADKFSLTVKREMGGVRAATITVLVQCTIAWIAAFLVHGIGLIFGLA